MASFTLPPSKWWYALDPHTYKVLGKAHKLVDLQKRFPDGAKVLWSKHRVYKIKE